MPPKRDQKNRNGRFLPQALIESILARLPVKSLLRFKCVSKTWCTLISDPNPRFIKIFSHRFSQPPKNSSLQSHFIRCPLINMEPTMKLASEIPDDDIFLGSCNGLVCIGRPSSTQEIVLWNPATRLSKSLPHSTTHFGVARRVALGFGCNAKGDDFKVVRIFLPNSKKVRVGAQVYSSKDDSWTTIQVGYKFSLLKSTHEVIASGNPYWVALDIDGVDGFLNLLGFDATTLDLNKIVPWPGDIKTGIFVDWKGFLGGIQTVEHYTEADGWWLESIDVWIYNDGDEKKWTRNRRFKGIELKVQRCLACSSSGKILGELANRKMFIFDTERNHVAVSELKRGEVSWFHMFPYNESLAYVKGMRPVEVSKHEDEDINADIGGFFLYSLGHISGRIAYKYAMEI